MAKKGDKIITKDTSTKRDKRRGKKTGNTSCGGPAQGK